MRAVLALLALYAAAPAPQGGYAARLTGKRLVLKSTTCAGWAFPSRGTATRYDEVVCSRGGVDESTFDARVRWITPDSFVLVEDKPVPGDCPPRTWLYKVKRATRDTVVLEGLWTGWGTYPDSVEEYRFQQPAEQTP